MHSQMASGTTVAAGHSRVVLSIQTLGMSQFTAARSGGPACGQIHIPQIHCVAGLSPALSEREATRRMLNSLKRFWKEESGQGLVEYALILFLIAIVVIVALTTLGKKTNNVLNNIGTKLNA
jgi:pilus assembly protein Flp/PilA